MTVAAEPLEPPSPRPRGAIVQALVGGTLLALAMPGLLPSGGALLVLPGLMVWFALATGGARPLRDVYLFGCAFMAWFSWSLHHVMLAPYVGIALVGGLYFVLVALAMRGVRRAPELAFGVTVAASFWLRGVMPEIYYPHGQPVHALWASPQLLGSVVLGGEPLANALLGALAATLVGCWRAWRVAVPSRAVAWRRFAVTGAIALAATAAGWMLRTAPAATAEVDVAAVEPGIHPLDPYVGMPFEAQRRRFGELFEARLLAPTRELVAAEPPPDLVLWPEAALPIVLPIEDVLAGKQRFPLRGTWPDVRTRLLIGTSIGRDDLDVPAAVLFEPHGGQVYGCNEKLYRVPGGEFIPFVEWLPDGLSRWLRQAFYEALGTPPDTGRGRLQPPMATASGHRFGALICYDNAFPGPSQAYVDAGAEFLVAVSNEAWYRGGAELDQLVAMSVCRALETGVPVVRCTTDGASVAVDRDGVVTAELPRAPAPTPAARILRLKVPVGPPAVAPMPWLRGVVGPSAALWLLLAILHRLVPWARLGMTRKAL